MNNRDGEYPREREEQRFKIVRLCKGGVGAGGASEQV